MATEQILSGYMDSGKYNSLPSGTRNFSLYGIAAAATEFSFPAIVIPTPGIFYDLKVRLGTAPGAGGRIRWYVRSLGGGSPVALEVEITEGDTEGENRTGRIFVNAGAFVVCASRKTSGTAASDVTWSVKFQPLVADQTILGTSDLSVISTTTALYWSLAGPAFNAFSATEKEAEILIPGAGIIKHLYVFAGAPGSGNTRTFTVRKNQADTSLVVVYGATDTELLSDLSNTVSVVAGDRICVKSEGTGTPTATTVKLSVVFVPDNSGEWIWAMNMLGNSLDPNPVTGGTYIRPVGTGEDDGRPESDHQNIITPFDATATIEAMYARLTGFPGPGDNQYSFTLRKYDEVGLGSTLVCDSAGIQSWTSSNAIADNDLLSIISVPFSSPTSRGVSISLLGKCTNVVALQRRVIVDGILQFQGDFQS